jgi:hypothetical protein
MEDALGEEMIEKYKTNIANKFKSKLLHPK